MTDENATGIEREKKVAEDLRLILGAFAAEEENEGDKLMWCKVCLKDVDEHAICENCGDTGLCEDCADECAELDEDDGP